MNRSLRTWFFAALWSLLFASVVWAGPHDLAVIRPGGPTADATAQSQVGKLIKQIAAVAGWPVEAANAQYCNTTESGYNYIKKSKPGFALITPGFYLKYRDELKLRPLNKIVLNEGAQVQYYVIVKKGTAATLADLKGKTLVGAHLAEPEYVERIVLGKQLKFGKDITVQTMSGLAALRKLNNGEVGAVLVDSKEYKSLGVLPFAAQLATLYTSPAIPNTGIVAVGNNATAADWAALQKGTTNFCQNPAGLPICQLMEITGFAPVEESVYNGIFQQYRP